MKAIVNTYTDAIIDHYIIRGEWSREPLSYERRIYAIRLRNDSGAIDISWDELREIYDTIDRIMHSPITEEEKKIADDNI